jgi:hypothetical protein
MMVIGSRINENAYWAHTTTARVGSPLTRLLATRDAIKSANPANQYGVSIPNGARGTPRVSTIVSKLKQNTRSLRVKKTGR